MTERIEGLLLATETNLARADERRRELELIREAHLYEAGRIIADKIGTPEDASPYYLGEDARHIYTELWQGRGLPADRMILCGAIAELLSPVPGLEPPFEEGGGMIAYFASPASHEAYEIFSSELGDALSDYPGSFEGACEDVYNGISEFCMLPVSGRGEGTLRRIRALADKYELHPALSCRIEQGGGETEFMLYRRSFARRRGRGQHFSFTCALDAAEGIADIITAARRFGMELNLCEPQPEGEDGLRAYDFDFSTDGAALTSFCVYMSLEFPQYTPRGVYREI